MSTFVSSYQLKPRKAIEHKMKSDHLPSILSRLNEDRKHAHRYCDVTILAGTGIFPVHLCVVSSYLEFFEKVFSAEMIEKQERIVKIFEINEETMETILNFIYTGEISVTKENVKEVLEAADYFQIKTVKDFCLKFMFDEVDFENCLSFEAYGRLFDYPDVREKVGMMVSSRIDLVLGEEEYKELEFDEFNDLLSLEHKKIASQEILYSAVIGWLRHQLCDRGKHAVALFQYVNFEKLSRSFLLDVVSNEEIFTNSVACLKQLLKILLERIRKASGRQLKSKIANGNTFGTQSYLNDCRKSEPNNENASTTSQVLKKVNIKEEKIQQLVLDKFISYLRTKTTDADATYHTSVSWIKYDEEQRRDSVYDLMRKVSVPDLQIQTLVNDVENEKLIHDDKKTCQHFVKGLLVRESAPSGNHFLIFGGSRRKALRYDVINKELTSVPNLRQGRNASCVVCHKRRVYAIGGYKLKTTECLDLNFSTSNWEEGPTMKQIRVGAAACVHGDSIYVIGGRASANVSSTSHKSSTGERLDTRANRWTHVPSCNEAKCFHSLVQLNGLIYAVGSYNVEVFHPRYSSWRRLTSLQLPRTGLAAVALKGKIYAIGGYNDEYLSSVEVYDKEQDSWSFVSSMNEARSFHGACVINNKIYVAGGNSGVIESYDPSSDKWEVEACVSDTKWMDSVVAL